MSSGSSSDTPSTPEVLANRPQAPYNAHEELTQRLREVKVLAEDEWALYPFWSRSVHRVPAGSLGIFHPALIREEGEKKGDTPDDTLTIFKATRELVRSHRLNVRGSMSCEVVCPGCEKPCLVTAFIRGLFYYDEGFSIGTQQAFAEVHRLPVKGIWEMDLPPRVHPTQGEMMEMGHELVLTRVCGTPVPQKPVGGLDIWLTRQYEEAEVMDATRRRLLEQNRIWGDPGNQPELDAFLRTDFLVPLRRDQQKQHDAEHERQQEDDRAGLKQRIGELREFERQYRTRLETFMVSMLEELTHCRVTLTPLEHEDIKRKLSESPDETRHYIAATEMGKLHAAMTGSFNRDSWEPRPVNRSDPSSPMLFRVDEQTAQEFSGDEEANRPEWVPGRWWRVLDAEGELWCESSDEEENREAMATAPKQPTTLQRMWVTKQREEWRTQA